LIAIGAYQRGSDARIDTAINVWPHMQRFLQQGLQEKVSFDVSLNELSVLLAQTVRG